MLLVSLLHPKEHTALCSAPSIGFMANDFVNNSHPDFQKRCSFLLASELHSWGLCKRYPEPEKPFFFSSGHY